MPAITIQKVINHAQYLTDYTPSEAPCGRSGRENENLMLQRQVDRAVDVSMPAMQLGLTRCSDWPVAGELVSGGRGREAKKKARHAEA